MSYLDAYSSTYSVHNALPFRNLSVLGSGSGEAGTIRVEDHLGHRRGLRTLRTLHQGKFGIDSQYGAVTATSYPSNGSFNKQHRNGVVTSYATSSQSTVIVPGAFAKGSFKMYGSASYVRDDQLTFTGLQSDGASNFGIELDDNASTTTGYLAARIGNPDPTMWDETATHLETLGYTVNTSSVYTGATGSAIKWGPQANYGYSWATSSANVLGTSDTQSFSISFWAKRVGPNSGDDPRGVLFQVWDTAVPNANFTKPGIHVSSSFHVGFGGDNEGGQNALAVRRGGERNDGQSIQNQKVYRGNSALSSFNHTSFHHFLITYNGSTNLSSINVYFNGTLLTPDQTYQTLDDAITAGTLDRLNGYDHEVFFNCVTGSNNFNDGENHNAELNRLAISDLSFWGEAMTSTAARELLYNNGRLADLTSSAFSPYSLRAWYKMGAGDGDSIDPAFADIVGGDPYRQDIYLDNAAGVSGRDLYGIKIKNWAIDFVDGNTYPDHKEFQITGSEKHVKYNGATLTTSGLSPFFDLVEPAGGATEVTQITTVELVSSSYDNMHINSSIPRSEFQYSWINSAVSGTFWRNDQHIYGYAPRDGIYSSSAGYVEAIVFPTASTIYAE